MIFLQLVLAAISFLRFYYLVGKSPETFAHWIQSVIK